MPDETQNQAAGVDAAKPAAGGTSAAVPNEQGKDEDRLALRQRAIDAERKAQKLEEKLKSQEDEKLKESGKWQEVATKKESEANQLKASLRRERLERALITSAGGFNDPEDVVRYSSVPDDLDDGDRDSVNAWAKSESERVAKTKPYLLKTTGKNGTPFQTPQATPGGQPSVDLSKVTTEDIRAGKLTKEQLAKVAGGGGAMQVDYLGRPIR